jgi:hypothetical protein
MSDFSSVLARTDANIGTFVVTTGNVMKGTSPLITWFNDKSVIIAMNARSTFSLPAEHAMFDGLIMALTAANIGIMYVDSLSAFMNPDARFKEFLEGTLDPTSVGMTLTTPETVLPNVYKSVKAKFDALFTAPVPPMSAGIDLTKYFDVDQIAVIEAWRSDKTKSLNGTIRTAIMNAGQSKAGLLRLVSNGNTHRVENDRGNFVSKTRFMSAYTEIAQAIWARLPKDHTAAKDQRLNNGYGYIEARESNSHYNNRQRVEVYPDYLMVGCQAIPRAEVEAMVAKINALNTK